MAKIIRMGNDIPISWSIFRNEDPEVFTGKEIGVKLLNKFSEEVPFSYSITDNVISGTFYGKDQKVNGQYKLLLEENKGNHQMVTLDYIDVFTLSNRLKNTTYLGSTPSGNVEIEPQLVSSYISFTGVTGDFYTKDETDELLDEKVDKVEGKGLSTNDFTDEDKSKSDNIVFVDSFYLGSWDQYTSEQKQTYLNELSGYAREGKIIYMRTFHLSQYLPINFSYEDKIIEYYDVNSGDIRLYIDEVEIIGDYSENNYTDTDKSKVNNLPANTNSELNNKVDKVEGSSLIDSNFASKIATSDNIIMIGSDDEYVETVVMGTLQAFSVMDGDGNDLSLKLDKTDVLDENNQLKPEVKEVIIFDGIGEIPSASAELVGHYWVYNSEYPNPDALCVCYYWEERSRYNWKILNWDENKEYICKDDNSIYRWNGEALEKIICSEPTKITWSELKSLRDNSQLIPSQWYKITDYITSTSKSDTKSAEKKFDILVQAIDESHLSENAKAIQHPAESGSVNLINGTSPDQCQLDLEGVGGTSYFTNSNLTAWEIKYTLDNDTNRFDWADTVNGTGVIYYMKDEFENEAHYDFKNIMFKRDSAFKTANPTAATYLTASDDYYYTFTYTNNGTEISEGSDLNQCKQNQILAIYDYSNEDDKMRLPNYVIVYDRNNYGPSKNRFLGGKNNTFCGGSVHSNEIYSTVCYGNVFVVSDEFGENIITQHFKNNKLSANFIFRNNFLGFFENNVMNTIGQTLSANFHFTNNIFSGSFVDNTINDLLTNNDFSGAYINGNTFSGAVTYNDISGSISSNTFAAKFNYNIINCGSFTGNTFTGNCGSNIIKSNSFKNNSFGGVFAYNSILASNKVESNTISGAFQNNTICLGFQSNIGTDIVQNRFLQDFSSNTLTQQFVNNTLSAQIRNSVFNCTLGYCNFAGSTQYARYNGDATQVKYYTFGRLMGSKSGNVITYLDVTPLTGTTIDRNIAVNSNGVVKDFVLADLIP